jgi:transcriptional regulator with XRE-family HTH domain
MIDPAALAHARTSRGLSQRKLSALVGLNYQVIRRIEAGGDDGNLTLRDLQRLCDALSIGPAELLETAVPGQGMALPPASSEAELDLGSARLLRRIQLDTDVRRSLSQTERHTLLPALARQRQIRLDGGRVSLSAAAARNLAIPGVTDSGPIGAVD